MKLLIKIVLVLVVVTVGVIAAAVFAINGLARAGIEKGATHALGVETTLDGASVGVLSGEFSMTGLNVANPEGYDAPHFLDLGTGGVTVTLDTLMEETVRLPRLGLGDLDVRLERRAGKANYDVILENLRRLSSGEKPSEDTGRKRFVIDDVHITNINVHLDLVPAGGDLTRLDVPVDEIRLTGVGSDTDRGVLMSELSGVIIQAILAAVVEKGGNAIPADVLGDLRQRLGELPSLDAQGIAVLAGQEGRLEEVTTKLDQTKETVEKVRGDLDELGGQLKGLGDLLGGDEDKD